MDSRSSSHANLAVAVAAGVLVVAAMLLHSPHSTPLVDLNTPRLEELDLSVPPHLIRRVQPGMTYEEVDAIVGRYYFVSYPYFLSTALAITYGDWTVLFVRDGDEFVVRDVRRASPDDPPPAPAAEFGIQMTSSSESIEQLIDELVDVSQPSFGYYASFKSTVIAIPDDTEPIEVLLLGTTDHVKSQTLRKIIDSGIAAIPALLAHLDDDRKTRLYPVSGMMWLSFADEYDFNRRTRIKVPSGVNLDDSFEKRESPSPHAITVGDLCYVALGQIVNRSFATIRHQQKTGLVVSSPTSSQSLRKAIVADWAGLTKARHRQSLIDDFTKPDHEWRRIGAYLRLSRYYPDSVEELLLSELAKPTFDETVINEFLHRSLFPASDKVERRRRYDKFIAEQGSVYSVGVMDQLFEDLDNYNADQQKMRRELLTQFYGQPSNVTSTDRPIIDVASHQERICLIETMVHDRSQKVGVVVREQFLMAANDRWFAAACLRCLASRGYGNFLVEQLNKINPATVKANWRHRMYIDSVYISKEKVVRDKLRDILRTTANEAYFMAALPALGDSDSELVFRSARNLLRQLPADTEQGDSLLYMIRWRYPEQAPSVYREFLENSSLSRAKKVLSLLGNDDELALKVLPQLLDDRRPMKGVNQPTRVCDQAATRMMMPLWKITDELLFDEFSFDKSASTTEKDKQIEKLKTHLKREAAK